MGVGWGTVIFFSFWYFWRNIYGETDDVWMGDWDVEALSVELEEKLADLGDEPDTWSPNRISLEF